MVRGTAGVNFTGQIDAEVVLYPGWDDLPLPADRYALPGTHYAPPYHFDITLPAGEDEVYYPVSLPIASTFDPVMGFMARIIAIKANGDKLTWDPGYCSCVPNVHVGVVDTTMDATDDSTTYYPNTPKTFGPLGNDHSGRPETPVPPPAWIDSFTQPAHGTIEFVSGTNPPYTTLLYTPEPDYVGDDSFTYVATNGFQSDTATVQLVSRPAFTVDNATAPEVVLPSGSSRADFRVWLQKPAQQQMTVKFSTELLPPADPSLPPEERARASARHFVAIHDFLLTFDVGDTEKWVHAEINEDDIDEYDEKFGVRLSESNYIAKSTAVGTIVDTTDEPTLSINDATVEEPVSEAIFATLTVTLSNPTEKEATVRFSAQELPSSDDSESDWDPATLNVDFTNPNETVTIPTNELSFTVQVPVFPDETNVQAEQFAVVLSDPQSAGLTEDPDEAEGRVTILGGQSVTLLHSDADNDGVIDYATDDPDKRSAPGMIVARNTNDDNLNGTADYKETGRFRDANGNAVFDNDLKPVKLTLPFAAANYRLTLLPASGLRLWETRDKEPLASLTFRLGTDNVPETIYVEGVKAGQFILAVQLKSPTGSIVYDSVLITVVEFDAVAHRPRSTVFQDWIVPSSEELTGVGIRRNGNNDIKNNLLRVDLIHRSVPGLAFKVSRSDTSINVFSGNAPTKNAPLLGPNNQLLVSDATGSSRAWVEWSSPSNEPATFSYSLWDIAHNRQVFQQTIVFKPFTSIVIVLLGDRQVPADPAPPIGGIANGIYDFAIKEYREGGRDIYMFDEDDVDPITGEGPVFDTITRAVDGRSVSDIALLGYSHGGGKVYTLSALLATTNKLVNPHVLKFTSYVDAIESQTEDNWYAERRRPVFSQFHLNQFQQSDLVARGGPTSGLRPTDVQFNWTAFFSDGLPVTRHLRIMNWPTTRQIMSDSLRQVVKP